MPRLLFVNRFFYPDHSATSQILSDLCVYLASRGRSVSVITSRGLYDDPQADLPAFEEWRGVAINRVCKPRFSRAAVSGRALDYLAMYRGFAASVSALAKAGDILIVETDPPLLSLALAPVARRKRVIMINWLQDLYPEVAFGLGMKSLAWAAPLLIAARNAGLRTAAANVAIGELMTRRLNVHGIRSNRIATIPNWCDDESIMPRPPGANVLRDEWGLNGKFVVGYSGNLGRAHEFWTLLRAAEILRKERDFIFLLIGGGHRMNALKAEVRQRDLGTIFRFHPYQDSALLQHTLLLPDVHWISLVPEMEGLIVPSKFYGIAAAGRPIVAITAADGEIARLVRNFDCGVVVAPGDGEQLSNALRAMRDDAARRTKMGGNARAMLEQSFCRKKALSRWERLIDHLALQSAQSH